MTNRGSGSRWSKRIDRRRFLELGVAGTGLTLLGAGCGTVSKKAQQGGAAKKGKQEVAKGNKADIALVMINLQAAFFNQMVAGAKKAAKDAGASLSVFNANDDPSAQNSAIEDYVQQKVDGLVFDAIDVNGIKPAIKKAADANMPVVAVDAIVDSPAVDVQIGVDNTKAGGQMADFFEKWASQKGIESAKIGVVGALNSFIQIQRQDGFTKPVKAAGHEIVQVVDGRNIQEEAQSAAENLFTANPDMDAVYATGEPALIGAIAAARSQGMTNKVTLFGWDLSPSAIQAIDDGFLEGVVQQDPYTEGLRGVESVMKLRNNKKVPSNISIPIAIVTKDNVDKYRKVWG
jgi:ribose transport system substrate-binding protein